MAKIILKSSDGGVATNKGLKLDFGKVSKNDFILDFEVTGSKFLPNHLCNGLFLVMANKKIQGI